MNNSTNTVPSQYGNSWYGRNMQNNNMNMNNMNNQDMNEMAILPAPEMRTGNPTAISIYSDESMMPETMTNTAYIPAYLRHQIGRWMRIEFLVGNILEEKVGQLLDVGASFLILKMLEPSTTMLCDLYSIKFITIIYDANLERLYTR